MALSRINANSITDDSITVDQIADTAVHGRRNLIINGAMQVAQRGTQSSVTSAQYGSCDRFYWFSSAGDTVTLSQDTSAPDGFQNSFKLAITTADSSLGANELARIEQRIEGQNLRHLKYGVSSAESVTLSFYVKTNKTGTYAASIFEETGSNVISKTYTVSSADTWEFKSITFPGLTSASISATNGTGLRIWWGIGAGSNYTGGSNDAWTSGATNWFEGQAVNVLDSTSNTFFLTGIQLEVGDKATPFEHRSYGEELGLCQRYFYRIGGEKQGAYSPCMIAYATSAAQGTLQLPTHMRAAPSLSISGAGYKLEDGGAGYTSTSTSFAGSVTDVGHINYWIGGFSGLVDGNAYYAYANSASHYIDISAEL